MSYVRRVNSFPCETQPNAQLKST